MSFREKSAWISAVTLAVIYGRYFLDVVRDARAGRMENFVEGGSFVSTVITLVVVQVILHIVVASFAPKDADAPFDERERLIDLKATNAAYTVLISVAIGACWTIGLGKPAFYTTNGLLAGIVFAEIVRAATGIYYYRRGV